MADTDKQRLRRRLRQLRAGMPPSQRADASNAIVGHIIASSLFKHATTVTAYASLRREVCLDALWPASSPTLLLPRVDGQRLHWHPTHTLPQATGSYGIREPAAGALEHDGPVDLWLIPAVGVDNRGMRLGQGGGFYDRALSGRAGLRVAVVFACQRVPMVPTEAHDQPIDAVVTEDGWWFAPGPSQRLAVK
ncbi:MAG: 5-formyltetrahydrofolate cyclo-ligase [Myxococcota bacterium]|jgi:5-formyltetrahydrofolate cyclo-ligase